VTSVGNANGGTRTYNTLEKKKGNPMSILIIMENFVRVGYTGEALHLRITESDTRLTATVSYRGCHNVKTFRNTETAHMDAKRWLNDNALPIIHGTQDTLAGHK
jgi:hypothetical protein